MTNQIASLSTSFQKELNSMAGMMLAWKNGAPIELVKAHKIGGQKVRRGAVQRAPSDTGNLRNRILTNTTIVGSEVTTEIGTNVGYAVHLEFGTEHIAGGRVKALGLSADITDAQAVKDWPAKSGDRLNADGSVNPRVLAAEQARIQRGGANEQMPWLRPAFNAEKAAIVASLIAAVQPGGPGTQGRETA
jgi:hypothetical protein